MKGEDRREGEVTVSEPESSLTFSAARQMFSAAMMDAPREHLVSALVQTPL